MRVRDGVRADAGKLIVGSMISDISLSDANVCCGAVKVAGVVLAHAIMVRATGMGISLAMRPLFVFTRM